MNPKPPIALQLFAVRGECERSLPQTLKQVAAIGYAGAEPWGFDPRVSTWQKHSAPEIRRMYDDNGLVCCGFHLPTDAMIGDNLLRTADFNRTLGNRFLVIAADRPRMSSRAGIAELAGILNEAAEKLRPLGMLAGYHAHGFDFERVEGEIAWDILFGSTHPQVIMQLDSGNCASGGGDPLATLRKFPGRARSVHLKEFGGAPGAAIGEGSVDWKTLFELCDTRQPVEWYVVEQGSADGLGFDICRRSLQALRKMGR